MGPLPFHIANYLTQSYGCQPFEHVHEQTLDSANHLLHYLGLSNDLEFQICLSGFAVQVFQTLAQYLEAGSQADWAPFTLSLLSSLHSRMTLLALIHGYALL